VYGVKEGEVRPGVALRRAAAGVEHHARGDARQHRGQPHVVIEVRMRGDDRVEVLHAERREIGGDELRIGAAVDQHVRAARRLHERGVALSDVQEPHHEAARRARPDRRGPDEEGHQGDRRDDGAPREGAPGA